MATQDIPTAVPSDGTVALWWVPASVEWDPDAPSLALLAGAEVVALQCYLKENFTPNVTAEAVTDRRMCSKQVFEDVGTRTYTIEELIGIYDPQDPTGASGTSSTAYAALAPDASGHLVARWGIDLESDTEAEPAVGQFVDSYPVKIATRRKMPQEANSQLKFAAAPRVTGPVVEDVALVA